MECGQEPGKVTLMTKFFAKAVPAAILIAATTLGTVANAQSVCGARDSIIAQLKQKYGETRRSLGLQQGRGVVEIFASEETGSWTILVTDTGYEVLTRLPEDEI